MPAVSTMKHEVTSYSGSLNDVIRQPSPQRQVTMDANDAATSQRHDVMTDVFLSGHDLYGVTSQSADYTETCQTMNDKQLTTPTTVAASASSSALVSSPETGWRAVSGSGVGKSWDRRTAATCVSSPADGEPADVALVAASPTVGQSSAQTSDSGSSNSDPLATLMRLYGTLATDGHRTSTLPDGQLRRVDNSPLKLPVLPELSNQPTATGTTSSDEYIMRELQDADDERDGPTKSYICHVCQYIGTSRSMYLQHMSEHFKHRCTLCGYMTSYAGRLKRHLEDCHSTDEERPVVQRKPILKRCRKCGYESSNLKLFYDHVRTHIRPERILECPTASCPFVTEYRHHLELHLRNHLNSRPIRCPICPYRCAVSSMLASHLKSHTKVHRFRCSACRFSSKFSNALKRHLLEKGHGRGYVLNPDGSIPEGGAVPFEPGSPTTRQRPKVASTTKTATVTTAMLTGSSEAQRKPTRSVDVTSEVALAAGVGDVKAALWTPPVAASSEFLMNSSQSYQRRPVESCGEIPAPVKYSPAESGMISSGPVMEAQLPPLPALTSKSVLPSPHQARSLYACAVCGYDADNYVLLARHVMTSHYSAMMTSEIASQNAAAAGAASSSASKRRDNSEYMTRRWPPSSDLPMMQLSHMVDRSEYRPSAYDVTNRPEFVQPGFPVRSMPVFSQTSSLASWPPPQMPTALASVSTRRAELENAMSTQNRPGSVKADEVFRARSHDRYQHHQMMSIQSDSDVVAATRRTNVQPPENFANISTTLHGHELSRIYVEETVAPSTVSHGSPLDLSAKTSTSRYDQLPAAVQADGKRSRRKGKAYKVDVDSFNTGNRDDELGQDMDYVDRYNFRPESNGASLATQHFDAAAGDRARILGGSGSMHEVSTGDRRCQGNREFSPAPQPEAYGWSRSRLEDFDGSISRKIVESTLTENGTSSGTPYHECRHCGLGFRDGELFAMHMDFHGRHDPFTCKFCGVITRNEVEFFLHVAHAPHNVRPVYVV